ncbi:MAG: phosphatidylglycerophosphatase A [Chromatiales bacterium]|nr:MAG: phosphatidylglycerophosphatase A [Chromatiales bacterium]
MSPDNKPSVTRQVIADPVHWLAFGFGAGLAPVAPGTWGSALAVAIYWVLAPVPMTTFAAALVIMFIGGIWICGVSARRLGVHDHSGIVWDEIVGMLFVLLWLPPEPLWIGAAFLAFRLFDIWKPWPIRDLDHSVPGGLGIMLDDLLAAAYAVLLTVPLQRIFAAP